MDGAPETAINGTYNLFLVALSIVIAVIASYSALDLAGRVTASTGVSLKACIEGGAMVMGVVIWSIHFIGMLALSASPMTYSVLTLLVSMVVAVFASGVALWLPYQFRQGSSMRGLALKLGSALAMGGAISGMQYTGMAARFTPTGE
ncbi:MHYT domain-containing protein [Rubrobacter aplysinae]|uniref:MHYT domain-containing protein n=1 Tax=Rubrobacter aplysinae TaxID=909625 RepID=UPI001F48A1C8|nr:MHYT domain-containing protein [Rubrobacter aplysinae]